MNRLDYYYSYAEVDLRQIRQNLANMQAECDRRLIPVVKGNAWGQGTVPIVSMLFNRAGYDITAVAQVTEAVEIREAGFNTQTIMLLSGVPFHAIPYVVKYNLLMPVFNKETVRILSSEVKKAGLDKFPIQIKIDTGLHRVGVQPDKLEELLEAVKEAGNLDVIGIMTHYTEGSREKIQRQYDIFKEIVLDLKDRGYKFKYISSGCSTNIKFPEEDVCTHVRVGWGFIAYVDNVGYDYFYGNKPSLTLRSFITNITELKAGESVGYGDLVLQEDKKIACISIGQADGMYRRMTMNGGPLLIRGQYAHYIDSAMDQTIIDITGIDCELGDEVTIYGKDKYTDAYLGREEVAKYSDGNCSILEMYLTDRVRRIYIDD